MLKALEFLKSAKNDTPCEWLELDEAIKELEELENRSCDGCKFGKERYWDWDSGRFPFEESFECKKLDKSGQLTPYSTYEEHKFYCSPNFYCNKWEPKQ